MIIDPNDPMNAPAHMATPYHATVHEFRRGLMADAVHFREVKSERSSEHRAECEARRENPDAPEPSRVLADAYVGSLMASEFAYALAAILGVAEREVGKEAAERLASVADEILANGDECDLNKDVAPGTPVPPPTPAEQERAGQMRLVS